MLFIKIDLINVRMNWVNFYLVLNVLSNVNDLNFDIKTIHTIGLHPMNHHASALEL